MPLFDDGYEINDSFLNVAQLKSLDTELQAVSLSARSGGVRNIDKKFTSVRDVSVSPELMGKARKILDGKPNLVRALLFNKTANNNWLVTWHQDRTVAVSEKFDDPEWGPWSIKEGVHRVQPPISVLNQMVTFRIHLDNTNAQNGCLRVMPKSHLLGLLGHEAIQNYVKSHKLVVCEATAGSVLIMRPHLLHSSGKATIPTQRRVLHLEYSSFKLPAGVQWV